MLLYLEGMLLPTRVDADSMKSAKRLFLIGVCVLIGCATERLVSSRAKLDLCSQYRHVDGGLLWPPGVPPDWPTPTYTDMQRSWGGTIIESNRVLVRYRGYFAPTHMAKGIYWGWPFRCHGLIDGAGSKIKYPLQHIKAVSLPLTCGQPLWSEADQYDFIEHRPILFAVPYVANVGLYTLGTAVGLAVLTRAARSGGCLWGSQGHSPGPTE